MYSDLIRNQILSTEKGKKLIVSILQSIIDAGQDMSSSVKDFLQVMPKVKEEHSTVAGVENGNTDAVDLVVPDDSKTQESIEQKVLDSIVMVEQSVAKSKIKETAVAIEEEGLFQMDDGYKPDKEEDTTMETSESFHSMSGINSSEEMLSTSAPSQHSKSLTTPTITTENTSFNVTSLPNSLEQQMLLPLAASLSPSNSILQHPSFPVDQAPLSVRMGGKLNEENDEFSVVGVAITKKKKKALKKKKKSVSSKIYNCHSYYNTQPISNILLSLTF